MLSQPNRSISDLIHAMRTESTRWDAIIALRNRTDLDLGPLLVQFHQDPEWVIRWIICEKWGDMGYSDAVPLLINHLHDRDFHVRKNAAKALMKLGLPAVQVVIPLLDHVNPIIRQFADTILLNIGDDAIQAMSHMLPQSNWIIANRMIDIWWRMGTALAQSAILSHLSIGMVQKHAIVALGDLGNCDAIPHLLIYINHPKLKRFIITAFHYLGEKKSYPLLIAFLDNPLFTEYAKTAILRIGPPCIPYIKHALKVSPDAHSLQTILKTICNRSSKEGS